MEDKRLDAIVIYRSYHEAIQNLPVEDRLAAYEAICEYGLNGIELDISGGAAAVFTALKPSITKSRHKSENGRKGGQAKGRQKANEKQTDSKQIAEAGQISTEAEAIKHKPQGIKHEKQDTETQGKQTGAGARKQARAVKPGPGPEKVQYAERVYMTEEEHAKLVATCGVERAARCIEKLDAYKGSNGKTYKSDYSAILNWVIKAVEEEEKKGGTVKSSTAPLDSNTFKPSRGWKKAEPYGFDDKGGTIAWPGLPGGESGKNAASGNTPPEDSDPWKGWKKAELYGFDDERDPTV